MDLQPADFGRMRWRCRRGTRELDALLTWYLSHRFVDSNPVQQDAFERLLEAQDPDVYDWCMGRSSPPDEGIAGVVDAIRAHHFV